VDVDQEGATGYNVVGPLAASETPRGAFATGYSGNRSHRGHGRGTGKDAAGSGHHRGPRLITHDKPDSTLMGKDANRNRL
jgi:hypothetical protein